MTTRKRALLDAMRAAEALARSIGREAVLRLLHAAIRRVSAQEAETLSVPYMSDADAWDEAERLSGKVSS